MTEKENYLRASTGKEPAWVPRNCGIFPDRYSILPPAIQAVPVGFLAKERTPQGGKDIWGVRYVTTKDTGGMAMPDPSQQLFDDVTKWRDYVKAPSLEGIDWAQMAAKGLANVDRSQTAVRMGVGGLFLQFMGMVGFEEGLISLVAETEEVHALFDYMTTFYEKVVKEVLFHYKPDVFMITDDTATALNPFFSMSTYRELLKPYQKRLADLARESGAVIAMHNCGRCEDAVEDWVEDLGVQSWEPAQVMNDLAGIKAKYGNRLMLVGCWDSSGPAGWAGASEELVRSEVRKCIDAYAPGGGFCFWASAYGERDDAEFVSRLEWITDEYNQYGRTFYKRQG